MPKVLDLETAILHFFLFIIFFCDVITQFDSSLA